MQVIIPTDINVTLNASNINTTTMTLNYNLKKIGQRPLFDLVPKKIADVYFLTNISLIKKKKMSVSKNLYS